MRDNRTELRLKTSAAGRIVGVDSGGPIKCCVKDLSAGGAKIEVEDVCAIPPVFDLEIPQLGAAFHAETRWRYAHLIGVRFVLPEASACRDEDLPTREDLLAENAELQDVVRTLAERLTQLGEPLMISLKCRTTTNVRTRRPERHAEPRCDASNQTP